MNIPNSNIKFYYTNQLVVSVKLPIGCKPTVYMGCGKDNRPFNDIVKDIRLAADLIENDIPKQYTQDIQIAYELPKLLGYCRVHSNLL